MLQKGYENLSNSELGKLVNIILGIQKENYITKKKRTAGELKKFLGLTP